MARGTSTRLPMQSADAGRGEVSGSAATSWPVAVSALGITLEGDSGNQRFKVYTISERGKLFWTRQAVVDVVASLETGTS